MTYDEMGELRLAFMHYMESKTYGPKVSLEEYFSIALVSEFYKELLKKQNNIMPYGYSKASVAIRRNVKFRQNIAVAIVYVLLKIPATVFRLDLISELCKDDHVAFHFSNR